MASIYQINLHKSELATEITTGKHSDAIYLMQEIYYNPKSKKPGVRQKSNFHGKLGSRAAIYLSALSSCTFVPMQKFMDDDIATGIIEGGSVKKPTIISSIYLDIEQPTIMTKFRELVKYSKDFKMPLICGLDCNAHSPLWGSYETNERGENLEDFIFEQGLYVENVGATPTWTRRGSRDQILDITLTLNIRERISDWHVLPENSLSDHKLIYFKVDEPTKGKIYKRNYSKANWPIFKSTIETKLPKPPLFWSNFLIESSSLMMTDIITEALDKACPKHLVRKREKLFWWNQECSNAKTQYTSLERRMLKARNGPTEALRNEVREARRAFKKAVRRAKRDSFRNLVSETADVASMAKLNKILDRKQSHSLGLVTKPDGSMSTSTSESLSTMIKEHFPGSYLVDELGEDREFEDPPRPLESCPWITNYRIRQAIKQFGPDKSAGPDDLKPIVLHNLPECAITFMKELFNACIQTGYTPIQWCHSKVAFMPKPCKESYLEPRSFRPLSLMIFQFKALERLVVWRVEETALRKNPFHHRQFAFRKNMSTDNALSESVNMIEKSFLRGGMAIVIYLDIRGAFDNISTKAIIRSLKLKEVENTVLNWYENYLDNRTCEATLGNSKVTAQLTRGAPQGGCASPTLGWNCPYDDFLRSYDNTAVEPYGFADDSKLVILGCDFETIFGIAQTALKMAESWARSCGVSFCPNKCAALFFNKGQFRPEKELQLYGEPIKWEDNTKYLGIFMDNNLDFQFHIENKIGAAKRKLMILKRVFEQTWGPRPKLIRWAYTGIVRPALTYGCVVWAKAIRTETMKSKLNSLQRLALVQIAGVRPSTPTAALELIYNVPPLDIHIQELALKTAVRINIKPNWFPNNNKGHQHLLFESLSSIACLDDNNKTREWEMNYSVVIEDGKDITDRTGLSCYTDGSKINDRAGVGGIILKDDLEFCHFYYRLGDRSVYQAEICAIISATKILLSNRFESQVINIMVDNQASLKALLNPESASDLIRSAKSNLNLLGNNNVITLRWIEGHKGWKYNEIADRLAKRGAEPYCNRKGIQPRPSIRSVYSEIESNSLKTWTSRWQSSPDCRQTKYFWVAPSKRESQYILSESREIISQLVRFLTGHAFLKRHNAVVFHGISPPPGDISCRLCEDLYSEETPHHIITECEALHFWRLENLGAHILEEYPQWKSSDLIKYLGNKDIILLETE